MLLKSLTGVHALGSPSGEVTPDGSGVFDVDHATGEHLLRFGGWEQVGPGEEPEPAPPAAPPAPPEPAAAPTARAPRKSRAKPKPATK